MTVRGRWVWRRPHPHKQTPSPIRTAEPGVWTDLIVLAFASANPAGMYGGVVFPPGIIIGPGLFQLSLDEAIAVFVVNPGAKGGGEDNPFAAQEGDGNFDFDPSVKSSLSMTVSEGVVTSLDMNITIYQKTKARPYPTIKLKGKLGSGQANINIADVKGDTFQAYGDWIGVVYPIYL
jgi:hypothetical protein